MKAIGVLAIVLLIIAFGIFEIDLKDQRLLKEEGKLLYSIKGQGKNLYLSLITSIILTMLLVLSYLKYKQWELIIYMGCFIILFIAVLLRAMRKCGFYENILVLGNGCFKKEEIKSYYWSKYMLKAEAAPLMLEVASRTWIKGRQTILVEVEVPQADIEQIEAILQGYGIEKKKYGESVDFHKMI